MSGDGGRVGQRKFHACIEAVFAVRLNAQRGGDAVRGFKADALYVLHKPVGIAGDDLPHVFAIPLIDFDGKGRGDAVTLQKDHRFALLSLLGIAFLNHAGALFADARHVQQLIRLGIEHVERFFAEGSNEQFGRRRADAADHAAGEIFFNSGKRSRFFDFKALHFDLAAVNRVLRPFAGDAQFFPDGNRRHDAHGADARSARLDHQNGIAVFVVSEYRFIGKGFDCFHRLRVLPLACGESIVKFHYTRICAKRKEKDETNKIIRNNTDVSNEDGIVTDLLHGF